MNNKGKIHGTTSTSEKTNLSAQSVKVREGHDVLVKGQFLWKLTIPSCGTSNNSLSELQKKKKNLINQES